MFASCLIGTGLLSVMIKSRTDQQNIERLKLGVFEEFAPPNDDWDMVRVKR